MQKPTDLMRGIPLFEDLEQNELPDLAAKCEICHIRRGDALFLAGDKAIHVYIVLSGSAKLVRAHSLGKERIVHLLTRGELFGAAVAIHGGNYPVNAIALEQSSIMKIEIGDFQEFFLKHPKVGNILIAQLGDRLQQAHSDRVLSFDATDKRVAVFLLDLLDHVQTIYGKTSSIPIPLTRQDIADRVGTTVETVIRILSGWSKQQLIATHDKYIEIPNPAVLRETVLGILSV